MNRDPSTETGESSGDEPREEGVKPQTGRRKHFSKAQRPCPTPPTSAGDVELGRVLRIQDGIVVIEKKPGVVVPKEGRIGFHDEVGDERLVGKLIRVNNKTYHVRVHINEQVDVGEMAYLSAAEPSSSLVYPSPSNYEFEAALTLKPWLGLGGSGSGLMIEGHFAWQYSQRFKLTLATAPTAPPIGTTPGALEAYLAPSLTFGMAEMGFGVGVGTHNTDAVNPPGVGFLLTPILRIGAEDGLMFRARSSAVVHAGLPQFGSFRIDAAIPIYYGMRLLAGGGGGDSGYGYGEVGLELLLAGNGLKGSWLGSGLFGYGGTHEGYPTAAVGPYMGLGVKRRF